MLGTLLEGDDHAILCIGPDWLDVDVLASWNVAGCHDELPTGTKFDRDLLFKYSARQMRDHHAEHDSYWGEDGELQSFVVGATPSRATSECSCADEAQL